jgi:hypothetical protein
METMTFDKDLIVFYVPASSFPAGVKAAHEKLHSLVPFSRDRKYFGVSRPENDGGIQYKAAAEELSPGEGKKLNCDTLVLKKGRYAVIDVPDFMNDTPAIGSAFDKLTDLPNIDQQGYCVEWYVNDKDVKCMVRLAD